MLFFFYIALISMAILLFLPSLFVSVQERFGHGFPGFSFRRPCRRCTRHPGAALALLSLSQLLIALDATIVFVALDSMGRHLGMGAQQLQWVISAYSVAFGGCLLLGGRCADLGRRRMYVTGMVLFGLASLAGGFAGHSWQLVMARAGQGVAAALLFPATLSLINTLYAAGPQRNRPCRVEHGVRRRPGCWCAAGRPAHPASGLELGAVDPGARGLALRARCPALSAGQRRAERSGQGFDLAGCISVTLGSSLLVAALVQGPEWGFGNWRVLLALAVAAMLLALFVRIEARAVSPLIPLALRAACARPCCDHGLHEQLWRAVLLPGPVLPADIRLEPLAGRPGIPAADGGVHGGHTLG